jgi:hypothetical protein
VKLVLGLAALMLGVAIATLLIWRNVRDEPCAEREISRAISPDGRAIAEVLEVSCASAVATHVSLRPREGSANARQDVFVATGVTPVALRWRDARQLLVESPARTVVLQETGWRNVGIEVRLVR